MARTGVDEYYADSAVTEGERYLLPPGRRGVSGGLSGRMPM